MAAHEFELQALLTPIRRHKNLQSVFLGSKDFALRFNRSFDKIGPKKFLAVFWPLLSHFSFTKFGGYRGELGYMENTRSLLMLSAINNGYPLPARNKQFLQSLILPGLVWQIIGLLIDILGIPKELGIRRNNHESSEKKEIISEIPRFQK